MDEPTITQGHRAFSLACAVAVNIRASATTVWGLLTGGFAPLFKGVRTFTLTPCVDGTTNFAMDERFSGLMLPLAKGSMPDFGPVFARYASDLKREAERDPR